MVGPSNLAIVVPSQRTNKQHSTVYTNVPKTKHLADAKRLKHLFVLRCNWHFAFLYQILSANYRLRNAKNCCLQE